MTEDGKSDSRGDKFDDDEGGGLLGPVANLPVLKTSLMVFPTWGRVSRYPLA